MNIPNGWLFLSLIVTFSAASQAGRSPTFVNDAYSSRPSGPSRNVRAVRSNRPAPPCSSSTSRPGGKINASSTPGAPPPAPATPGAAPAAPPTPIAPPLPPWPPPAGCPPLPEQATATSATATNNTRVSMDWPRSRLSIGQGRNVCRDQKREVARSAARQRREHRRRAGPLGAERHAAAVVGGDR